MAKRPTIEQLAAAAGVSVATVDRVLNKRLPVRAATAERVREAAERIGFHAAGLIGRRIREDWPAVRLGFLLLKTGRAFYGAFACELEAAVAELHGFRGFFALDHVAQTPAEVAAGLERMAADVDAVALVAPEHPTLTAAVQRLKLGGVPVFSLLSDFAADSRRGYVGVNNMKVGRTAAWMIAACAKKPGKVALFVGSHRFHGHELREIGFRAFFREAAPNFAVLDTMVNLETRQLTHDALLALAERHEDLVGAYVAGGGMEGAVSAMRALRLERRPVTVVSEITAESRAALAENLVAMAIATPIAPMARELVRLMAQAAHDPGSATPGQTFLPFDIHLPESV